MKMDYITLDADNIDREHICCAISDKKCSEGYALKKEWLKESFKDGYVFRRLNERAKVFIEYGPAEKGWVPLDAPGYLLLNCFWVSGQYKGNGHAKRLLQFAIDDAVKQKCKGLVTVAGNKKFHFMSDGKWLIKQGFEIVQQLPYGFNLLVKTIAEGAAMPRFRDSVLSGECDLKDGLVVYYSNRCPFTEYTVNTVMKETASKRNIALHIYQLKNWEQAQSAPTPATIFSLFYNGQFITTDISVCLDNRFDKIINKI